MTFLISSRALLAGSLLAGSTFLCSSRAWAQNTSEIGFGLGALNYKGEVSPQYQLRNNRPAFTIFYRKNVSAPVTLRGGFTAGLLRATDDNVNGDNGSVAPVPATRQTNMKGSLLEASAVLEYNFLNYHDRQDHRHFTPYGFIGLAGYYANTTTHTLNGGLSADFNQQGGMVGLAIPAGVGIKYALSEFINLGLETGVRKTFTDRLDHLGEQTPLLVNNHDQDWYYYSGVSVSYTFYKIRCPKPYKGHPKLLR